MLGLLRHCEHAERCERAERAASVAMRAEAPVGERRRTPPTDNFVRRRDLNAVDDDAALEEMDADSDHEFGGRRNGVSASKFNDDSCSEYSFEAEDFCVAESSGAETPPRKSRAHFSDEDDCSMSDDVRQFQCPKSGCQSSFTKNYALKRHIDFVHNNIRPHKCDNCSSTFRYPYLVKEHAVVCEGRGIRKNGPQNLALKGSQRSTTPLGSQRNIAPLGSQRNAAPLGAQRNAEPLGSQQNAAPLGSQRNPAPVGSQQNVTPLGSRQNVAPFPKVEEKAKVRIPQEKPASLGPEWKSEPRGSKKAAIVTESNAVVEAMELFPGRIPRQREKESKPEHGSESSHERKRFNCGKCYKAYSKHDKLEAHIARAHIQRNVDGSYGCAMPGCESRQFVKKTAVENHVAALHGDRTKFPCNFLGCEKSYSVYSEVSRHMFHAHGVPRGTRGKSHDL